MFYSKNTDVLLKSKGLLCFFPPTLDWYETLMISVSETGSLQQLWLHYRNRQSEYCEE